MSELRKLGEMWSSQSGIPGEGTSGQGNPIGQSLRDVATGTGAAAQVAENDSKKGRRRKGKAGAAGKIVGGDASKSASGGSGADAAKSAGGDVGASAASNARSSSSFLRVGNGGGGSSSKKLSLLDKMKARLAGSRFRSLNEALYTSDGDKAFQMFSQDPSAFTQYHEGYREQVASWPINPLHVIIDWIRQRPATLTVADFGCGEAKLAASVPNKVVSLDLVAAAPGVIACNMAHTPLQDSSVHIAVFCLSLMGADYPSFLSEAHRVLQPGGSLIIAEVRSRFDPTTGGAELKDFVAALKQLGFRLVSKDLSNKMFLLLFLEKVQSELKKGQVKKNISVSADITWPALKPCLYKRR
ncbi:unnamed protein product [Closterium sp. Naga37s-1]|nr:unnamed protein product [Closterium sp. Naga37s-1]